MLMDEPFSGLDQRLRESVRAETLTLLRETRASCLLVTHDPVEAMGLADRIFLMRQGHLIQSGTPEQLYRQPVDAAAARFFSDANEMKGHVAGRVVDTPLGAFPGPNQLKGAEARETAGAVDRKERGDLMVSASGACRLLSCHYSYPEDALCAAPSSPAPPLLTAPSSPSSS